MRRLAAAAVLGLGMNAVVAQTSVPVYAAGSLRAPLTEAARAFESTRPGTKIEFVFGASGLLRDRIRAGKPAQVFATAEQPDLRSVDVPAAINVTADYGLAVRQGAPAFAQAFADYLLSPAGQGVLQRHGFRQPD